MNKMKIDFPNLILAGFIFGLLCLALWSILSGGKLDQKQLQEALDKVGKTVESLK